jgi:hypothetical protein
LFYGEDVYFSEPTGASSEGDKAQDCDSKEGITVFHGNRVVSPIAKNDAKNGDLQRLDGMVVLLGWRAWMRLDT